MMRPCLFSISLAIIGCAEQSSNHVPTAEPPRQSTGAIIPIETSGPPYPAHDRRWEHEGSPVISYRIDPNGSIGAAEIAESSDWPGLDEAARSAVKRWKFKPIDHAVTKKIKLNFKLTEATGIGASEVNSLRLWILHTSQRYWQISAKEQCASAGLDISSAFEEARRHDKFVIDSIPLLEKQVFNPPINVLEKAPLEKVLKLRSERLIRNEMQASNASKYCAEMENNLRLFETSFTSLYPAYVQFLNHLSYPQKN